MGGFPDLFAQRLRQEKQLARRRENLWRRKLSVKLIFEILSLLITPHIKKNPNFFKRIAVEKGVNKLLNQH
ncbi:hypothetical protein CDG79_27740 [Nostoc sp. 'Peltigera membranacea cyanobiont' 232]|nr:hypothetical protein CDG79_27740 [Nostoc sp. 'Peltigera membranacea cyanobiont' 232]